MTVKELIAAIEHELFMRWLARASGFLMLGMVVLWGVGIKSYAEYLSIPKLAAAEFHTFDGTLFGEGFSSSGSYIRCQAVFVPSTGKLAVYSSEAPDDGTQALRASYCNRIMSGAAEYTTAPQWRKVPTSDYLFVGFLVIIFALCALGLWGLCCMVADFVGLRGLELFMGLGVAVWYFATVALLVSGTLGAPPKHWRFQELAGRQGSGQVEVRHVVITRDGRLINVAPTLLDWAWEDVGANTLREADSYFDPSGLKDVARAD